MCSSGGSAESSAGAGACARGLTLVQTHLLLQLCQALVARWSNNHIFSLQMATESTKRGHSIGVGGRGTHHAGTRAQAIPIVAACLCPCLCIGLLLAMGAGQAEVLSGTDRRQHAWHSVPLCPVLLCLPWHAAGSDDLPLRCSLSSEWARAWLCAMCTYAHSRCAPSRHLWPCSAIPAPTSEVLARFSLLSGCPKQPLSGEENLTPIVGAREGCWCL